MEKTLEEFRNICNDIKTNIHSSLEWKWDTRFNVALIVLTKQQSKKVYSLLTKDFNESWNENNIEQASITVKNLVNQMFGVRNGQLLFSMNPEKRIILFSAWWPWENGTDISIRIGIKILEGSDFSATELEKKLKSWFELS